MQPAKQTRARHRRRIESSADRLRRLLTLEAPDAIICAEIALLVKKATLVYGPAIWTEIGKCVADPVRGYYDVCSECLEPVDGTPHCARCQAEIDVNVDVLEAEFFPEN